MWCELLLRIIEEGNHIKGSTTMQAFVAKQHFSKDLLSIISREIFAFYQNIYIHICIKQSAKYI